MPNKLTLSRIILSPVFMIFFEMENPMARLLGFAIYCFAALTDLIDGHYARKYGIVTGFGKFMDPLADKILVTSAFITLVSLGYARAWMVVLNCGSRVLCHRNQVPGCISGSGHKSIILG